MPDLNPQQINMRSPRKTGIRKTQVAARSSRSATLLASHHRRHHTGWTLPRGSQPARVHRSGDREDLRRERDASAAARSSRPTSRSSTPVLAQRSGFWAFHRLRHLFRLYDWYAEQGDTSYTMNYIDTKNDEYWRIEPSDFVLTRSSKKPFSYDYQINFQCLELSTSTNRSPTRSAGVPRLSNSSVTGPSVHATVRRLDEMHDPPDYLKHYRRQGADRGSRNAQRVNDVVGYLRTSTMDPDDRRHALIRCSLLDNRSPGWRDVIGQLAEDIAVGVSPCLDGRHGGRPNEWHVEARKLTDFPQPPEHHRRTTWIRLRHDHARVLGGRRWARRPPSCDPPKGRDRVASTPIRTSVRAVLTRHRREEVRDLRSTSIVAVNYGDTIFLRAARARRRGAVRRHRPHQQPERAVHRREQRDRRAVRSRGGPPDRARARVGVARQSRSDGGQGVVVRRRVTSTGTAFEVIDTRAIDEGPCGSIDQWIGYTVTKTTAGISPESRIVTGATRRAC